MSPVSLYPHYSSVLRFILACSFTFILLGGCSRGKPQEAASQAHTEQAVTITTRPVETHEVKRTVEMVGTLSGWEEVTISNETAGTIEKILVDLGDKVKKGQLLIRLDQREAKLALAQAEANLQAAKKALAQAQAEWRDADLNLTRIRQLHSEGVIATSQLDGALVDLAHKHLSDTEIVAPISSEVQQRLVSIGEGVKEKTPLLHLVVTDPLKLQGTVPERFAPEIKIEQPVDVQVEAFTEQVFSGMVQRVSPAVDVQTRSLALEAKVPNSAGLLKPGFFAKGLILIGVNPQAVFVPEEAVYSFVGITKAFVVRDGTAQERQVKTGVRTNSLVEVTEGLQPGETVATSGLAQLYQGAKVRVVNGKES